MDDNDASLPLKSQLKLERSRNEGSQEREGRMVRETIKNEMSRDLAAVREQLERVSVEGQKANEELNNKVESNFGSLWNVMSDLSTRLCKVEFS